MAAFSSFPLLFSSPRPLLKLPKPSLRVRCSSSSTTTTQTSFDLRTYWSALITEIESSLSAALPVRFPERIYDAMRYSVLSGAAKRAPPILCISACELLAGPTLRPAALPTACALEMVHAASLVHDDLPCMDSSPTRRGRPSTHSAFGVDLAVLAGDALFPLAFCHIVSHTPSSLVPPGSLARVVAEIARAVGPAGMAAGQFLDLRDDSPPPQISAEGVVYTLEKKFGEMAECSAVCGGILGGAGEEEVESLRRYGRAVGVLYEVVDDVLMMGEGGGNGSSSSEKMRSNASVVRALGMDAALEMVEDLRGKAKAELEPFGDRFEERVLPLYSFVDYAVERGFVVEAGAPAAHTHTSNSSSPPAPPL